MIYFNFIFTPSGGGYQNSISFLTSLIGLKYNYSDARFIVYKNTELEKLCRSSGLAYISIKSCLICRLLFEIKMTFVLKKGDVVFSIFGPPFLFTERKVLNIGGIALSNLFHKDVDFWGYLSPVRKLIKELKDLYRRKRYKKLDLWIFETDLLKAIAVDNYHFPPTRCRVIKMAPSAIVRPDKINIEIFKVLEKKILGRRNIFLFLCSAHPNKRLHILPLLAKNLISEGVKDFLFLLTTNTNSYYEKINKDIIENNLQSNFLNIGPVLPSEVATLISMIDYVCNISRLESFSNNFVEAWVMEKPLLVTRADWSRAACKDAAFYLEVDDIIELTRQFKMIIKKEINMNDLVSNGTSILSEYPTPNSKTQEYLDTIEYGIKIGKLEHKERSRIRF